MAKVVASSAGSDDGDPEVFEDGVSNVYRLVNNGGSVAAHFVVPFYAGGGTLSQRAFGVFLQGGATGPLDAVEDLAFTVGMGIEALMSMAVRDSNYERRGELFVGTRMAYQYVAKDQRISPTSDDRSVPFMQLAIGIRQGSDTRLSLTYTWIEDEFRRFMPSIQWSIQATGF